MYSRQQWMGAVLLLASAVCCSAAVSHVAVSASTEQNGKSQADMLLDGDMNTRWASIFADDQWVQLDFGESVTFNRIQIFWERAYASDYGVLISDHGRSWSEVVRIENSDGEEDLVEFPSVSARYLRLQMYSRATDWGNSIHEIRIFDAEQPVVGPSSKVVRVEYRPFALAVDVNQAFYAPGAKKSAVVRSSEPLTNGRFVVTDSSGKEVLTGALTYQKKLWDYHLWTFDFSALEVEGSYQVRAMFDGGEEATASITVALNQIALAAAETLKYFTTQRCGIEVPKWHKACHLDDGILPDGTAMNAVGGWHDCAGFDKEIYTTFLPVYFYSTIASESDLPWADRMMREARWGADWIMRMTDETGNIWCHVKPHNMKPEEFIKTWADGTSTDNVRGTADDRRILENEWGPEEAVEAMSMGALAKIGYLLRDKDPEYAGRCRDKAVLIMKNLKEREYVYADEVPLGKGRAHYTLFHAGMLLADTYLYRWEGAEGYLQDARERIDFIIDNCQLPGGEFANSSIERIPMSGKSASDPYVNLLCFTDFAEQVPGDPYVEKIKGSYRNFMEGQVEARRNQTPYGQAPLMDAATYHYIAVRTFQRNFEKPAGDISQGKNCYWLALATVCLQAERILGTDAYRDVATKQIDWVLGQNPFGVSTVADVGYRFPRMFTMWYWLKDHPAAEGVIPGGVINGIGGDKDDRPVLDMRKSNYLHWETNEYWNPPTAWFAIACWEYYKAWRN